MSSSSGSWQDRRFMFPAGKEVHQGSRRFSQSSGKDEPSAAAALPPTAAAPPSTTDNSITDMTNVGSSGGESGKVLPRWDGDRRFMFPAAKEVHQPGRRMSGSSPSYSSDKKSDVPIKTSASPPKSSGGGIAGAIAGRRRSSASSQGRMFSGLLSNRSSDTHAERRQSWEEMRRSEGIGGFLSNLVNKPSEKK